MYSVQITNYRVQIYAIFILSLIFYL